MSASLPLVLALFAAPVTLPTEFWQVAPDSTGRPWWQKGEPRKPRAVLLIHGLQFNPLRPDKAFRPSPHEWQRTDAPLVKALAAHADVFAFGYSQTLPLDAVAHSPALREGVAQMRASGYAEVILVGHSAGGVIARQFAELYPKSGVTKVVQVCAPNAGSDLAKMRVGYPKGQVAFVQSLAPAARVGAASGGQPIDPGVEFACVVGRLRGLGGDGLVKVASQWPDDLQRQGVPAVLLPVSHFDAMRGDGAVKAIAELVSGRLVRWTAADVDRARQVLFREPGGKADPEPVVALPTPGQPGESPEPPLAKRK